MPTAKTPLPDPPTCGSHRCRHCRTPIGKPRSLTTDDLRWHFGEAESALGIRSTLGAFVDMALSGISGGSGGNAVEARAVEPRRLDATGRHRCIRTRLAPLPPTTIAVLRAAYGADDWTRAVDDPQVRAPLRRVFGELLGVVLLTAEPIAHATRRQAPTDKPCADANEALARTEVSYGAWEEIAADIATREPVIRETGLRCAYRRPVPVKAAKKPDPKRRTATSADRAKAYLDRDPALAGSARGWAITTACGEDDKRRKDALRQARALLTAACVAASVIEGASQRPGKIRSVQLPERLRPHTATESTHAG